MTKKRVWQLAGITGFIYLASYLVANLRSSYQNSIFGLGQDPVTKQVYLRPKRPASWIPAGMTQDDPASDVFALLYDPLIYADRKLWHRDKWLK
ncbi:MAG: hypothetical protein QM755_23325 [Luteolibacter sp.]